MVKHRRKEFPTDVREAAWERCNGHCEECTAPLRPGKFRYDHTLPDWLGGEPTLENCQVLCDNCDGVKTYQRDIPQIYKTKRQHRKHIGALDTPSRPMIGTKASGIRKRMNGDVEEW